MAAEASSQMLKTDLSFTDDQEKGLSGKNLQKKCLRSTSADKLIRIYCNFLMILSLFLTVVVLAILLSERKTKLDIEHSVYAVCPEGWIGFGTRCFYFSEDIRNWTFSQTFCASLEAELARFETLEELNFLKRYKGPSDHWIGLSRETSHHVWKWTDNTVCNISFPIKGVGECAYLNDNGVSSARTYTDRKWICSKPNSCANSCQIISHSM
ncbi:C-type lectin domain family 2 member E-like isoform X1 [Tupaia chinensis]|uniref:C-type lectin domain family 2 member E-like isoform X1 n=1 Tax=Tupaia chinensis TaxID=246437 RepID=UPI000FFC71F7|nr:C-type lectin domain family 2 member E-like isoform X1 [Tupaia chinensis]